MGSPRTGHSVQLVLVGFSPDPAALDWARQRAEADWGPVLLESPQFDFAETDYYAREMGGPLWLRMWAITRPTDASELASLKLQTNAWEADYANLKATDVVRPLNLDPGYLELGKFVLASTKNHGHRVYLSQGIYAEVTLHYARGAWQAWPWTYPNYRRRDYHDFLSAVRERFKLGQQQGPSA